MLKYGEVVKIDINEIESKFNSLIQLGHIKGDVLNNSILESNLFVPVIVCNSDNYIDIEYIFKANSIIYNLEECKSILKRIGSY